MWELRVALLPLTSIKEMTFNLIQSLSLLFITPLLLYLDFRLIFLFLWNIRSMFMFLIVPRPKLFLAIEWNERGRRKKDITCQR